jgi:hypothetical protein
MELMARIQEILGKKFFRDTVTFDKDVVHKRTITGYSPVASEPSLGTPHEMSYANRTASLVVDTSTTPAATWSAAVTLSYAPTGAKWAYCLMYRTAISNPDALVVARASGMTLDTAAGFQYKYPGAFCEIGGYCNAMVWIPIDANKQFKWCTVGGNGLIHIASPVAYMM